MGSSRDPGVSRLHDLELPDRYEIVRLIASGGMASVWLGHDHVLGREVAIKLLADQLARDQREVRRFRREARAAARLSAHAFIVTIYDVGDATRLSSDRDPSPHAFVRRPFIVMEHLAGGTVAAAVNRGGVDRGEALRWIREAGAALDYAHGRGVLHRDIKPANMLLDRQRMLHVGDFGLARLGDDTLTDIGRMMGTAAYISPEQALGRPATEASDRYSLAVVAYELLVGERPFTASHPAALARLHIEQEPRRASRANRTLPRAVDDVLARGLAKRPEQRWPNGDAFADALGRATASARRARTRPPSTRRVPTVGARLRRRGVALAALAAAAFAVGLAVGSGRRAAPAHGVATGAGRLAPAGLRASAGTRPVTAHATPARHRARVRSMPARQPLGTTTGTPASAATPPPSADALEARGHELMREGDYADAIAVLRQGLAAAAPGSLTHAYALFDLGRSLRLEGDARAAVPVLERRLQVPNHTGIVRQELALALRAAGLGGHAKGPASPAPVPRGPGHKHHGHDGQSGHERD